MVTPLYQGEREQVRIETWRAGGEVGLDTSGGAEVLVLEGGFDEEGDQLSKYSCLRVPIGGAFFVETGAQRARVWVKTGHLRFVEPV